MSEAVQKVPELADGRPETGPMQFGEDWPGLFIRGDNAFGYAMGLAALMEAAEGQAEFKDVRIQAASCKGLLRLLRSCDVRLLRGATASNPIPLTENQDE